PEVQIDIINECVVGSPDDGEQPVDLISLQILCQYVERQVLKRGRADQVVTRKYFPSRRQLGDVKRDYIANAISRSSTNWMVRNRACDYVYYELVGENGERKRRDKEHMLTRLSGRIGGISDSATQAYEQLVKRRILRDVPQFGMVELTHDVFAAEIFKIRRPTIKALRRAAAMTALAIIMLVAAAYPVSLYYKSRISGLATQVEQRDSELAERQDRLDNIESEIADSERERDALRGQISSIAADRERDLVAAIATGQYGRAETLAAALGPNASPEARLYRAMQERRGPAGIITCPLAGGATGGREPLLHQSGNTLTVVLRDRAVRYDIDALLAGSCTPMNSSGLTVSGNGDIGVVDSTGTTYERLIFDRVIEQDIERLKPATGFAGTSQHIFDVGDTIVLWTLGKLIYYNPDGARDGTCQRASTDPSGRFCTYLTADELADALRFQTATALHVSPGNDILVGSELGRLGRLTLPEGRKAWTRPINADGTSRWSPEVRHRGIARFSS
ncbi:MAG: hypothetical protein AAFU65_15340, partial [Pseudomonadota bacterium]